MNKKEKQLYDAILFCSFSSSLSPFPKLRQALVEQAKRILNGDHFPDVCADLSKLISHCLLTYGDRLPENVKHLHRLVMRETLQQRGLAD